MSIIAEFTVPTEQFALYDTLCHVPGMVVEVERVVTHGPNQIMPYFWTAGGDREAFEAAARDDPSVEDLRTVDELDRAVLYRAKWIRDVESIVYAYTETGAVLLDATGRDERWELQLRFDSETTSHSSKTTSTTTSSSSISRDCITHRPRRPNRTPRSRRHSARR
ncbi:bacterio-opsin activator domain-containing protein [Halalkalicoccus jeotgali]|uniref:Bacterio-opsin activator HTH domain protein n=1 Tax=Halalkalicoccus jeotgali (strain DSM 18796 / CECT 7217 / JCM 14584 / KCTC 4019 / B3) TaxID=795797 RepID=D8J6F8_HALJB|nr:bacterio-opsin activator domain-containing protein [Halalkalicoccus jeotgali]ADJ13835.1 Bacterio-opsin activator HTH domain protein [Halalkalicoccus jeotgali B3]ELY34119.1 bacterio-opsin activator HTH domain-containing protein [Halalkalicoccus jeotgali B3]